MNPRGSHGPQGSQGPHGPNGPYDMKFYFYNIGTNFPIKFNVFS